MAKAHIKFLRYCLLKKDSHHAKFQFRLENVSLLDDHCISRLFYFSGHRWKVQISKKNEYLGMFLRWYGTSNTDITQEDGDVIFNNQCIVCPVFVFLNIFIPTQSIVEGSRYNTETFEKLESGIGYGSMVSTGYLKSNLGYIVSDNLYLQLELKIVSTTFHDCLKFSHNNSDEHGYVKGNTFDFYGTQWNLVFYPNGEKDSDRLLKEEKDEDNEYSSIYLLRQGRMANGRLRHNVQYRISVAERKDIVLDKHFYYKESNAYGTCRFIPIKELEEMKKLDVSVTFEHVVPYTYFAYKKKDVLLSDEKDCRPFFFEDHLTTQWSFTLQSKDFNDKQAQVQGCLQLVGDKRIKKVLKKYKDIQVCWLVEILSPMDIEMSVSMGTKKCKRLVHDSIFNQQNEIDTVDFPITMDQVNDIYW